MSMTDEEHDAMVTMALDAIPGYPFLPCPLCGGMEGCDHGVVERATAYEEKAEATRAHVVKSRDVDNRDVVNSEELIRGMTEMAERFTARMDDAGEQITRLKAIIGQIETTLLRDSAAKDRAGNIDKRNFVGQAILLCRKSI